MPYSKQYLAPIATFMDLNNNTGDQFYYSLADGWEHMLKCAGFSNTENDIWFFGVYLQIIVYTCPLKSAFSASRLSSTSSKGVSHMAQ